MQPSVIRLLEAFEAFATRAEEDGLIFRKLHHLHQQLSYVQQQNQQLFRLVTRILQQTVTDPAQLQAITEELKASETALTEAVSASGGVTPPPTA
jgi:hypothetical protein